MSTIVVMGVSGSGKTVIAQLLAKQLSSPMLEGDSLHSARNIERMSAGRALTDVDRQDWLAAIAARIAAARLAGESLVVSCSALKRRYRDTLREADHALVLVYLRGDHQLIQSRVQLRRNHFMSAALLDSQFQTLEEPSADENFIQCDVASSPAAIVASILPQLPAPLRKIESHLT